MRLLKPLLRRFLSLFEGKRAYQKTFRRLYDIALTGMNYGTGDEIIYSGEVNTMRYVHSAIAPENGDIVIFDVGANVGKYTMALLDVFTMPHVRVHAFEPSVGVYRQLVDRLGADRRVIMHNLGFSDTNTTHEFFADQSFPGLGSLYQRRLDHRNITMDRTEVVELRTIDTFCRQHAIEHIRLLKLDVEGHELSVLNGAREMLDGGKISFVQWEFGGCNIDSRTYFQDFFYLLKDRYNIYRIVKDGLHPIPQYTETMEIFTTVNYLAELKP
jgi:FkbM family methyltransferase